LVAVGKEARHYVEGAKQRGMANVEHFDTVQEAIEFLSDVVGRGDVLLVKGSRGMKMETVVDALVKLAPVSKF